MIKKGEGGHGVAFQLTTHQPTAQREPGMPSSATGGHTPSQKQKQKAADAGREVAQSLPWTPVLQGEVSSQPIVFTRDAE